MILASRSPNAKKAHDQSSQHRDEQCLQHIAPAEPDIIAAEKFQLLFIEGLCIRNNINLQVSRAVGETIHQRFSFEKKAWGGGWYGPTRFW